MNKEGEKIVSLSCPQEFEDFPEIWQTVFEFIGVDLEYTRLLKDWNLVSTVPCNISSERMPMAKNNVHKQLPQRGNQNCESLASTQQDGSDRQSKVFIVQEETVLPASTADGVISVSSFPRENRVYVPSEDEDGQSEGQSDAEDLIPAGNASCSEQTENQTVSNTNKGDPAAALSPLHSNYSIPSHSPSMSRHEGAEADSYSVSTLYSLTSNSVLDVKFMEHFNDTREPAMVPVEEIIREQTDAHGFLVYQNEVNVEPQDPKEIFQHNKRIAKWREMVFGANNAYNQTLEEKFENWKKVAKHRKLKARIRKGIPSEFRREVWVYISGARELNMANKSVYHEYLALEKESGYENQIKKDIDRTYRQHVSYREEDSLLQKSLFNVLNTYALYNDSVGYCQGMNSVAGLMLMYMEEVDVFWLLHSLTEGEKYRMKGVWHEKMPDINLRFFQFEHLLRHFMPKVASHLEAQQIISCSEYQASQWFITGFLATKIPTRILLRMWDIYLNEGIKALFRFGLAIMMHFKEKILASEMEVIITTIGNDVSELTDDFIRQAMAVRITRSMLDLAEKEFNKHHRLRETR